MPKGCMSKKFIKHRIGIELRYQPGTSLSAGKSEEYLLIFAKKKISVQKILG